MLALGAIIVSYSDWVRLTMLVIASAPVIPDVLLITAALIFVLSLLESNPAVDVVASAGSWCTCPASAA